MNKRILGIIILTLGLIGALSGCSFFDNTQVFLDEATKSQLEVPKDWKLEENDGQKIAKSPDDSAVIAIMGAPVPPEVREDLKGAYTLDSYNDVERATFLTNFKAGFIRSTQGVNEAESGFLKTDKGHTFCYIVVHSQVEAEPSMYMTVLIQNDRMISVVGLGKTRADFDKNKKQIEKILKTLKVD